MKVNISASVDETVNEEVIELALPKNEDRSFSKMVEILLKLGIKKFKESKSKK